MECERLSIKGRGLTACDVDTTTTKVIVYHNNEIVGVAGVRNPKDFDYECLLKIAVNSCPDEGE